MTNFVLFDLSDDDIRWLVQGNALYREYPIRDIIKGYSKIGVMVKINPATKVNYTISKNTYPIIVNIPLTAMEDLNEDGFGTSTDHCDILFFRSNLELEFLDELQEV